MITVETSIPQGFAGGLNRDNVATVLDQLRKGAARQISIWIDMESGLRSDIDGSERFDVNRAWAVCAALDAIGWDDPDAPSPSPVTYDLPPQTTLIKHALAAHKVTLLRGPQDGVTPSSRDFRRWRATQCGSSPATSAGCRWATRRRDPCRRCRATTASRLAASTSRPTEEPQDRQRGAP